MTRFALMNARVIDGLSPSPLTGTSVLVEDGHIAAVGNGGSFGGEVVRIDATGKTVLPGLIDAHIHLAQWGQNLLGEPCEDRPLPGGAHGRLDAAGARRGLHRGP